MDLDGEDPPAAKKPRLGAGGATNDDADTTIEEHIALGEWIHGRKGADHEGARQGDEKTTSLPLYS